jgi:aromatic ring-opening dioxygenase catalytic subunit (LigB family)
MDGKAAIKGDNGMNDSDKLPVYYIPHGGGPWHVMEDGLGDPVGYGLLRNYLTTLGKGYIGKIKSILILSAHWEEAVPTIHFGSNPSMFYDYYGFSSETYRLQYPAPGNPALAAHIESLLKMNGFTTKRETERGYDHGTFVPLMVAFPEAQIPVVQLSLVQGLDPAIHIRIGKALESLRYEGVLIIGSGMSYHNMRGFMSGSPTVEMVSKQFDDWLADTVSIHDSEIRNATLIDWRQAPVARDCHPRSEHLVPLFVIAGAAGKDAGHRDFSEILMRVSVSGFKFG